MSKTGIEIATEWAGGRKVELARRLGTTKQNVSRWGDWVPELWACKLQVVSGGTVLAAEVMEPDYSDKAA